MLLFTAVLAQSRPPADSYPDLHGFPEQRVFCCKETALNPKHDLGALYEKAVGVGLIRSSCMTSTDLQYLSELQKDHYARHPDSKARE